MFQAIKTEVLKLGRKFMNISPANNYYGQLDASYQAAGGLEGVTKLVNDFYDFMEQIPEVRVILEMHPQNLAVSRDKLVCFLSGWLGGPRLFAEKYGSIGIPRVHAHLDISETERDMWLLCMQNAVAKQDYADDFQEYIMQQLAIPAEFIRKACAQRMKQEG